MYWPRKRLSVATYVEILLPLERWFLAFITNIQKSLIGVVRERFRALVGEYYLNNFSEIKFEFIRRIVRSKGDGRSLVRLVTGYTYTKAYLYKMNLVESTACMCNFEYQDINHIFWSCPILKEERRIMVVTLRVLKIRFRWNIC